MRLPFLRAKEDAMRFLALLMICLLLPAMAGAQEPAPAADKPQKIGFVDIEVVLDSSRAIRTIVSEIDADLADRSRDIDSKRLEAQRLRRSLEQQGAVLSEQERRQRQEKALDLLREVDELEFKFSRLVREKQRQSVEPLLEEVIKIIGDVARRENFDLVVRGEVVLYGRESVDLTPAVIREVDSRVEELRKKLSVATQSATSGDNSAAPAAPVGPVEDKKELLPLIPE
jgi:outer membrane protein